MEILDPIPILDTERTVISSIGAEDERFIIGLLSDPRAMQFWPRPYTYSESVDWIMRMRKKFVENGCAYWIASLRDNQNRIGVVGLLLQEVSDEHFYGLGYILHPDYWHQGFATECCRAIIEWACTRNFLPVHALVRPENEPSRRVALRLGMRESRRVEYYGFEHIDFVLD